jgi:ABC-type ATPase with predicted acetyltransferase domain
LRDDYSSFSYLKNKVFVYFLRSRNIQFQINFKPDHPKGAKKMAVFKCEKCGATKEGRCKPKKCPECTEAGTMQKQEEKKSSGCGCSCKK